MTLLADEFFSLDEAAASGTAGREPLDRTTGRDFAAIEFALQWQSEYARHNDLYVANQLNLWRDYFPPAIESAVAGQPVGHVARVDIAPGELVAGHAPRTQIRMVGPEANMRAVLALLKAQLPRANLFYWLVPVIEMGRL